MSVSLHVGRRSYELGAPGFLGSFFSTIYVRLESSAWGSRFPVVMRELYSGHLKAVSCEGALREISAIGREMAARAPQDAVWDHENRATKPPWGNDISPQVKTLADFFVTSAGESLLVVLASAVEEARRQGLDVQIE